MSDVWAPEAFKARTDTVLAGFLDDEAAELLAVDDALDPLAEALRTTARHGKRLRAAFCYWGWRAAGQPDSDALMRAAAAMELVHAAAVVHDDLIDDSPLRHGRPTAHHAFAALPQPRRRPRAAARALALLLGDHLMALAGRLYAESGLPAAYLSRGRPLWAALARELVAGEALEILHTGGLPDTGTSLKVIRYKTAKYTVEQPLLLGALLAGAPAALREGLSRYGLPLGEAFQLRDDLLGLFGDPARTGKAPLDDLRTARPTVLLAETWSAADPAQRALLRGALDGDGPPDDDGLREVRALMTELGAPARVERMIAGRVEEAVRTLDDLDLPGPARRALTDLAHRAAVRHH
ncbi:polyprenyl synthetase family protein [Streptomyces roseofulvus]|uniref:Polyprenyl synthetase family protein n=2 Tax=Streptomyces TaxID=1883 RepID=A0ABU4K720_9ACTN|nr:polyprenyl synthetase family protein [Streptomyces roseolus]MDX2293536.1 polyprenyl synthetase family protein [Streptomyces roseolus]